MDITNENFVKQLPEITETIQDCDFVAIDTELSGLMREKSNNRFDLPEERFANYVESSRGYFIMQFGLSCYTQVDRLNYTNKTYNFYIFPQPNSVYGDINRTFCLQAHAIQFLSEHRFDFNKLFRSGVSYLTFEEKKALAARLKSESRERSQVKFGDNGIPDFVPPSLNSHCKQIITKVNRFVDERKAKHHCTGEPVRMTIDNDTLDPGDRLKLTECSTGHRRSIMRRVIECLPAGQNLEVTDVYEAETNETYLAIEYIDPTVKSERMNNALTISKGFLEIIELIIVHKKPIVGHNLSLDLIKIINQFIEPLTDDYNTFKETCQSLFPLVYDTKYIAHTILDPKTLTQNQSRLNDLFCQLNESKVFPQLTVGNPNITSDEKHFPHQAGYDAYMSGYCFIVLCEAHIASSPETKSKQTKLESTMKPSTLPYHRLIVDEFANKIHLSYSYDFKYLDLAREERQPSRSHVFYLEFPCSWTLDDLFQVFHQHGGVEACRLDKTSALCALRDKRQANEVLKMVKATKNAVYKIYTYDTYVTNFKATKRQTRISLHEYSMA